MGFRLQASTGHKLRSLDHLPLTTLHTVQIADAKQLPALAALAERHIPAITNACESACNLHHHDCGPQPVDEAQHAV
jgi:hypothetical protein